MPVRPAIPNFTLSFFCGRGASSEVWIGVDADGVQRAIKVLPLHVPGRDAESERRAITEYRSVVNRHERLLDILYIGCTGRYLYYVMDLADNVATRPDSYEPDTLEYRLRNRRFSLEETLSPKFRSHVNYGTSICRVSRTRR